MKGGESEQARVCNETSFPPFKSVRLGDGGSGRRDLLLLWLSRTFTFHRGRLDNHENTQAYLLF